MAVSDWSTSPASNANQVGIPMFEGMAPASLNDAIRNMMAQLRSSYIDPDTLSSLTPTQIAAWIVTLAVAKNDLSNVDPATGRAALGLGGGGASGFTTGDVKGTFQITPNPGWLKMNGLSIGNATSGATARANADTYNLFNLLWSGFNNAILPIQTSSGAAGARGATALADYTANMRMPIFDVRGRFLRAYDDGAGVDPARILGSLQLDAMQGHYHLSLSNGAFWTRNITSSGVRNTSTGTDTEIDASTGGPTTDGQTYSTIVNGASRVSFETRPMNVSLNYFIAL